MTSLSVSGHLKRTVLLSSGSVLVSHGHLAGIENNGEVNHRNPHSVLGVLQKLSRSIWGASIATAGDLVLSQYLMYVHTPEWIKNIYECNTLVLFPFPTKKINFLKIFFTNLYTSVLLNTLDNMVIACVS